MAAGVPSRGVWLGWAGLATTIALGALAAWVAATTHSFGAAGAAGHLAMGLWVWIGILLHEGRRTRVSSERIELERLSALAQEGRRTLFDGQQVAAGEAAVSLERFRRVGAPILAVLVAVSELALAWFLATHFPSSEPVAPTLIGAATLCGSAFVFLVLGRYGFALSRAGLSAAGGGGRRATSAALALFLAGLALAAEHTLQVDVAESLGYAFVGLEGLLGLEALALLLLEAYRPRRASEEARPPYDSRLLGLLSAPQDLARTIAQAMDYQFGFALSQTWFYRFLERWVVPLCTFAVGAFWLLSCFTVVGPSQQALVRYFGNRTTTPLGPGLHLKLPWPISSVQRVESTRLQTLVTGGHLDDDDDHHPRVLTWTEGGHVKADKGEGEDLVLLAREQGPDEDAGVTPVNLLAVAASIHYEIHDLDAFVTNVQDPAALLEVLAERELSFLLSGEDLDELLRRRGERASELRTHLQRASQANGLGVEIISASLTDLHPPVEVGLAFEEITVALERGHAQVLDAEVYAADLLPRSRSEAEEMRMRARIDAHELVELAKADAARFEALRAIHAAAPQVWQTSRLLDRLADVVARRRLVVLGRPGGALTDLDLQEKVSAEDIGLGQRDYVPDSGEKKEDE